LFIIRAAMRARTALCAVALLLVTRSRQVSGKNVIILCDYSLWTINDYQPTQLIHSHSWTYRDDGYLSKQIFGKQFIWSTARSDMWNINLFHCDIYGRFLFSSVYAFEIYCAYNNEFSFVYFQIARHVLFSWRRGTDNGEVMTWVIDWRE